MAEGFGEGDPSIPAAARRAHDEAVARGRPAYVDPATGFEVMTAASLAARGFCCGLGCRHCPYPAEEQERAGRNS